MLLGIADNNVVVEYVVEYVVENVVENVTKNVTESVTDNRTQILMKLIKGNNKISIQKLAPMLGVTGMTIARDIEHFYLNTATQTATMGLYS